MLPMFFGQLHPTATVVDGQIAGALFITPLRYLFPRLKCQGCDRKDADWDAVDKIPTVTESCLRSILKGFKGVKCNLTKFPKIPEIIFARVHSSKQDSRGLRRSRKLEVTWVTPLKRPKMQSGIKTPDSLGRERMWLDRCQGLS